MTSTDARLLDFFQEPVLLLDGAGRVLAANRAARVLFGGGDGPVGRELAGMLRTPAEVLQRFLRRCSGTTSPLVGAIELAASGGEGARLRVYGARLSGVGEELRLALRCEPAGTGEFSVLARKVSELNAEIRERRAVQARLEEALAANMLLLRELQHRVMNNIQLILSLFSARRREPGPPELVSFIDVAAGRLLAVGAVQQLMYQTQKMDGVAADELISRLATAIRDSLGPSVQLDVAVTPVILSNETAFPLALIVNELVTNAVKYAGRDGPCSIAVSLERDGGDLVLTVQDDGPGFTDVDTGRRSSGLGLVRGLCRQIGGGLSIENEGGARCIVRFADPSQGGSDA